MGDVQMFPPTPPRWRCHHSANRTLDNPTLNAYRSQYPLPPFGSGGIDAMRHSPAKPVLLSQASNSPSTSASVDASCTLLLTLVPIISPLPSLARAIGLVYRPIKCITGFPDKMGSLEATLKSM